MVAKGWAGRRKGSGGEQEVAWFSYTTCVEESLDML